MMREKNKKNDAMHENFRSKHVMHARMLWMSRWTPRTLWRSWWISRTYFWKVFNAKKTCKTPNLEIFNAWTLWMQKCIWKTIKDTQQEIIKMKQEDLPRTTWRSWRTLWMHEFSKNARCTCNWHQTYYMTQDSNKKQKNLFDFMIF